MKKLFNSIVSILMVAAMLLPIIPLKTQAATIWYNDSATGYSSPYTDDVFVTRNTTLKSNSSKQYTISNQTWYGVFTPMHAIYKIVDGNKVYQYTAFCVQQKLGSPHNQNVSTTYQLTNNWPTGYTTAVKRGIARIMELGYPCVFTDVNTSGYPQVPANKKASITIDGTTYTYTADEWRQITANAIRRYLADNGISDIKSEMKTSDNNLSVNTTHSFQNNTSRDGALTVLNYLVSQAKNAGAYYPGLTNGDTVTIDKINMTLGDDNVYHGTANINYRGGDGQITIVSKSYVDKSGNNSSSGLTVSVADKKLNVSLPADKVGGNGTSITIKLRFTSSKAKVRSLAYFEADSKQNLIGVDLTVDKFDITVSASIVPEPGAVGLSKAPDSWLLHNSYSSKTFYDLIGSEYTIQRYNDSKSKWDEKYTAIIGKNYNAETNEYTDRSGNTATVTKLVPGRYRIKESKAGTGYVIGNSSWYEFTITSGKTKWLSGNTGSDEGVDYSLPQLINIHDVGTLNITKQSGSTDTTGNANGNGSFSLAGAKYIIHMDPSVSSLTDEQLAKLVYGTDTTNTSVVLTTNAQGKASQGNLPFGKYIIEELDPSTGYLTTMKEGSFTLSSSHKTEDYTAANVMKEPPNAVLVGIKKGNANPEFGTPSYENATYTFYELTDKNDTDYSSSKAIGTITTAADGSGSSKITLMCDKWYGMKETTSPAGYDASTTVFKFTPHVVWNETTEKYDYTIEHYNGTISTSNNNVFTITYNWTAALREPPRRGNVEIYKVNAINEDVGVSGAVYGVYTDENCTTLATGDSVNSVDGTNKAKLITDGSGHALYAGLEEGTYYLKEISTPDGYKLNTNHYEFTITKRQTTILYGRSGSDGTYTFYNVQALRDYPDKGTITIKKFNSTPDYTNGSMSGAQYTVYVASTNAVLKINGKNAVLTIGNDNTATLSNIPYGTYYLIETRAPLSGEYKLHENEKSQNFTIDENHLALAFSGDQNETGYEFMSILKEESNKGNIKIHKVDKYNNAVSLAGATYAIYTNSNATGTPYMTFDATDTYGNALLVSVEPGNYWLKEINPPDYYKSNNVIQPFTVEANKTTILDGANGNTVGTTKIFNVEALKDEPEGSPITIVKTSTNPELFNEIDGAIYGLFANANANVDNEDPEYTFPAILNGTATLVDVAPGTYYLKEIYAPEGFDRATGYYQITVAAVPTAQTITAQQAPMVLSESPSNGKLVIYKVDYATGEYLGGAKFEVKRGSQTWTMITDENGKAELSNLEKGTYSISEIAAPQGYQKFNGSVYFSIYNLSDNYTGSTSTINGIDITYENAVTTLTGKKGLWSVLSDKEEGGNGNVVIKKIAAEGTPESMSIDGAVYKIQNSETGDSYTLTISNGTASKNNIPTGTYILTEISAPEGFNVNSGSYEFEVLKNKTTFISGKESDLTDEAGNYDNVLFSGLLIDNMVGGGAVLIIKDTSANSEYLSQHPLTGARYGIKKNGTLIGEITVVYGISAAASSAGLSTEDLTSTYHMLPVTVNTYNNKYTGMYQLLPGTYTLYEIEAPDGYSIKSGEYEFTVTENRVTVIDKAITSILNDPVPGNGDASVWIHKVGVYSTTGGDDIMGGGGTIDIMSVNNNSASTNAIGSGTGSVNATTTTREIYLNGAVYELFKIENGQEISMGQVTTHSETSSIGGLGSGVTQLNGMTGIAGWEHLQAGTYKLHEVSAPSGWEKSTVDYTFTLEAGEERWLCGHILATGLSGELSGGESGHHPDPCNYSVFALRDNKTVPGAGNYYMDVVKTITAGYEDWVNNNTAYNLAGAVYELYFCGTATIECNSFGVPSTTPTINSFSQAIQNKYNNRTGEFIAGTEIKKKSGTYLGSLGNPQQYTTYFGEFELTDDDFPSNLGVVTNTGGGLVGRKYNTTIGLYYIIETAPAPGFSLNPGIKQIILTSRPRTPTTTTPLNGPWDGNPSTKPSNNVYETGDPLNDPPIADPQPLLIKKVDADTETSNASGDASLENAEFTIKYYKTHNEITSSMTPAKTWVFKTDANGEVQYDQEHFVSGDSLYTVTVGDSTVPVIPLGTITIQETKAPEGYNLNSTVYVKQITAEVQGSESIIVPHTATIPDEVKKGEFELVKYYADRGANNQITEASAQSAAKANNTVEPNAVFMLRDSSGNVVAILKTDAQGRIHYEDLPYGTYTLTQTSGTSGYSLLDEPIEIIIAEDGDSLTYEVFNYKKYYSLKIIKKDAESGQVIAVAGTQFKLKVGNSSSATWFNNGAIYTTGSDGSVVIPGIELGTYTIVEVKAPTGYSLGSPQTITVTDSGASNTGEFIVEYTNEKEYGDLYIHKKGNGLTGTTTATECGLQVKRPTYGTNNVNLAGAKFDIYANEEIKFGNTVIYQNGQYVGRTNPTNASGETMFAHLPKGNYKIVEVTAPNGYYVSTTGAITVFVDSNDGSVTVSNTHKPLNATAVKLIQTAILTSNGYDYIYQPAGEGFIFGLYTAETITENGVSIAANTRVAAAMSDSNGNIVFDGTFPLGEYYVKEEDPVPTGFKKNTETFEVSIYDYSNTPVISVDFGEITNDVNKVSVQIKKTDAVSGQSINVAGVTFEILTNDDDVVERVVTNSSGIATLSSQLPNGTYKLKEISAPAGYVLDETPRTFTITDGTANPYVFTFADSPIKAKIVVMKRGNKLTGTQVVNEVTIPIYTEGNISGVTFELYAAEDIIANGSQKYAENQLVATGTTNANGVLEFADLWLGRYYIIETNTPNGYLTNEDIIEINATTTGTNQAIVTFSQTVQNVYQPTRFTFIKYAETVSNGEIAIVPGSGFVFGLYTKNAITENGITIPADTLVGKATSTSNGEIVFEGSYPKGDYYIKEISAPTGWVADTDTEYPVTNNVIDGSIQVVEVDGGSAENALHSVILQVVKKDAIENRIIPVAGAEFELFDGEGASIGYFVTDSTGTATFSDRLLDGAYSVKEVKAPNGYALNNEPISFTIDVSTTSPYVIEISDTPIRGNLGIKKLGQKLAGTETETVLGYTVTRFTYSNYALQNVKFKLVADEDIVVGGVVKYTAGATVKSATNSNSNGNITFSDLYPGKYSVVETQSAAGYYYNPSDPMIVHYELKIADASDALLYNVEEGSMIILSGDGQFLSNANNTTSSNPRFEYINQPVYTNFSLEKRAELLDGSFVPGVGFTFGLYTAEAITSNGVTIPADTLVEVSQSMEEQGNGGGVIFEGLYPYGHYYIKELAAPTGWIADTETQYPIDNLGYNTSETTYFDSLANEIDNMLYKASSKIVKVDTNNNPIRVAGIVFQIKTASGSLVEEVTTNSAGEAAITAILDENVTYYITEVASPSGYVQPSSAFTVKLSDLTPVDDGNGGTIYEIKIQNTPIKGSISVIKTGLQPDSVTTATENGYSIKQINYVNKGLQGAVIGLYQAGASGANTDITYNSTTYHLVSSQTTNASGTASFTDLALGTYLLKEISAPAGYLLNSSWAQTITLSEGNKTSAIVTAEANLTNTAIKTNISFIKYMQTMTPTTNASAGTTTPTYSYEVAGTGFLFGLYNTNAITVNGTTIAADTLLKTASPNSSGKVEFDVYLPQGSYYVKELKVPTGYKLDGTTKYTVTNVGATATGSSYMLQVNNNRVNNDLLGMKLRVVKYSRNRSNTATVVALQGAGIEIKDSNNVVVFKGYTDSNGYIEVILPNGTYTVHEFSVPAGHTPFADFTTTINSDTSTVTTPSLITETKYDDKTLVKVKKLNGVGTPLSGAHMQIKQGSTVLKDWTTDGTDYIIEGEFQTGVTYTLHEVSAPTGYTVASDINFTIGEDGNVYIGTVAQPDYTVKVYDYNGASMPATGSDKAMVMSCAGLATLVFGIAIFAIFSKKRKREEV